MFIGPDLHSPLDILPMQCMPTLDDLKKQDLASLRTKANQLNDLPVDAVRDFFSAQDLDKIHFLVWLPPANGESIGRIYPIPARPYYLRTVPTALASYPWLVDDRKYDEYTRLQERSIHFAEQR
jgi:hypothetical protein